jgi:hypothetical protein
MKQDTLLYFHRRNDNNTIFYVGIGGKTRPSDTTNRNRYWHNIVEKVGYSVEIIHTNLTWEQACILEIKYIKQFGRFDLGLGKLVNMTDGGDGVKGKDCNGEKNGFFNKKHNDKTLNKMSISRSGEKNVKAKLKKEDVIWIRNNYNLFSVRCRFLNLFTILFNFFHSKR